MWNVNLAEAKAHLSKLVKRAAAGETVHIMRRGKLVAQITAIKTPAQRIDLLALRALTDAMPLQQESARTSFLGCGISVCGQIKTAHRAATLAMFSRLSASGFTNRPSRACNSAPRVRG
jgi:antitoxin (DNA-binding transcriptional repressor) of toxin-antitoxin stability system